MMSSVGVLKRSVKDSLEEDEGSEEVEDEVFIRDGRNSCRLDEEIKRPLMAPRRKCKQNILKRDSTRQKRCLVKFCNPYCKISLCLFFFTCIALLMITMVHDFPSNFEWAKVWRLGGRNVENVVIPSTEFSKQEVWRKSFPGLKSEDSLTLAKLNSDEIEDIVIGYSSEETRCGDSLCRGGALALDGKTGDTLWQVQTRHQVLFVDCSASINQDPTYDCLLSGKSGVLGVVNGKSGEMVWEVSKLQGIGDTVSNQAQVYSAQYISDMDGDGWSDILAALTFHTASNLSVLSGHSGALLGQVVTPDRLLTLPRVISSQDETLYVAFATGTQDTSGYLFTIPLYSIVHSDHSKVKKVWSGEGGVSSDLLLIDMNQDQREDVVLTSGGNVFVLDGNNFTILWNMSFGSSAQILVGPIPAYFDNDKIPDLLITKLVGPSFPTFYYSETQVLSGKDGSKLLEDSIIGSGDITGEGISVSFTGTGNDMYLFWLTSCHQDDKNQTKPFSFPEGLSVEMQASIDTCRLRFNTSLESRLLLLSDHIQPPGYLLYSSDKSWSEEHLAESLPSPLPQPMSPPQQATSQSDSRPPPPPELEAVDDRAYELQDSVDAWDYPDSLTRLAGMKNEVPEYDNRPYIADPVPLDFTNKMAETLENIAEGNKLSDQFDSEVKPVEGYDNLPIRNKLSEPYDNMGDPGDYVAVTRKKRRAQHHTIPRTSTTPVLAPGLSGGIDVVFASHWISSPDIASTERCLHKKTSRQGMRRWEGEGLERDCNGEAVSQLTVYRLGISSHCYQLDSTREACSQVFPAYSQSFSHRDTHQYFKQRIYPQ